MEEGSSARASTVDLLHLRRLDRFLKRQGLHKTAHTLERESLAYLDAAHLQKLVEGGQWDAAWGYLRPFSPLWEGEEAATQHYTDFMRTLEHQSMLDYLACRGDQGGRAASSLFWWSDDAGFRTKSPETAQRHDLYRSMASPQARASVDWEAIKLTTLEKLHELLHLRPPRLRRSLRMREPQCKSTPSELIPLGLPAPSQRHQRKRVDRKSACEIALFLIHKRLSSSQETRNSSDSGVSSATLLQTNEAKRAFGTSSSAANKGRKRSRPQHDYYTGYAQEPFVPKECLKKARMAGDVGEAALASIEALESGNSGVEVVDLNDDEYRCTDEEDPVVIQKQQLEIMKCKTRQGKALEKRAARSFMDVLQEANLEPLPPHVPTYLRTAVVPPST